MPIPDYETMMLPILRYAKDGKEHGLREVVDYISDYFGLTEEERQKTLPSGTQTYVYNRVGWARTYMLKAGLLEKTKRGYFKIAELGIEALNKNPSKIDGEFLKQYPGFIEFQQMKKTTNSADSATIDIGNYIGDKTPDELIEAGFNLIQASLGQEILSRIRNNSPGFFETVVLTLLENMGYGKGEVTGRSGDGGIDGFIYQDKLGLDKILFQAKRFGEDTPVSASMIRDFIGTLATNEANKGVFITTSHFPKTAENTVLKSPKPIKLIDSSKLVKLMIEYNIGVSTEKTYVIKRIDSDFFIE